MFTTSLLILLILQCSAACWWSFD